jgi:molybdopterin/thiamine biosynthesis adenylyltransferase
MLLVAANLIARFCPRIDLAFSDASPEFVAETLGLLRQIDTSSHAEFRVVYRPDHPSYAASLSIGQPAIHHAGQTVIDSIGWLAVLNRTTPMSRDNHNSPFGALLAAALGAAEIFKSLLQPPAGTITHFGSATVSCFDYSLNGTDPGPCLPTSFHLPFSILGGIGAVGNAFLLALSFVKDVSGDLLVVDNDFVDWTNLNRYLLAFEADADPEHAIAKTELALRLFSGRALRVHPYQEPLDSLLGRIHRKEVPRPEIVLSAVDNNDARWAMQSLWPQLILEGATDRTLSQVSRHQYGSSLACLKCIHPKPTRSQNYVEHVSKLSGIRADVVTQSHHSADLTLSEEHITSNATEEQRTLLRRHVGAPICSILSELEKVSQMPSMELPVQPAASFVSMTAGLLMAGELVKRASGLPSALETLYQLDSFFPLENAFLQGVLKSNTCDCIVRKNEIRAYRAAMHGDSSL